MYFRLCSEYLYFVEYILKYSIEIEIMTPPPTAHGNSQGF